MGKELMAGGRGGFTFLHTFSALWAMVKRFGAPYRIELGSRSVNNFYWDFSLRFSSAEEKIAKKYF